MLLLAGYLRSSALANAPEHQSVVRSPIMKQFEDPMYRARRAAFLVLRVLAYRESTGRDQNLNGSKPCLFVRNCRPKSAVIYASCVNPAKAGPT